MVPGIYTDISTSEYHADPCPEPSLSRSLAQKIVEHSPLHAWTHCPRLNPKYEPDLDTKFDIGNIAHAQLIGRGHDIEVLPEEYDSWRTKASQLIRAECAQRGTIAVLAKHFKIGQLMARRAIAKLDEIGLRDLFRLGDGEVVIAWQELGEDQRTNKQKFWCRQMLDWLSADRMMYVDYKTTLGSAAPYLMPRHLVDNWWDLQAAFAERGLNMLLGDARRRFLFVQQEAEPPFDLTVTELSETALTMGRKKRTAALRLWQRCLALQVWPGYPAKIVTPIYPEWAEAQWLEREETEFDPELLMAG